MSPESSFSREFTKMSDVWSYGVTCLEIMSEKEPYYDIDMPTFTEKLFGKTLPSPLTYLPDDTPQDIRDLITKCLDVDPTKRPTFEAIIATFTQTPTVTDLGYATRL
jgi:serine/threonine protein kinase